MEITLPANDWRPRFYQQPFWHYMETTPIGARAILCHHRRAGKDHTAINWTASAAARRVGLYIHVFPYANQGRRIVWNGIDRDGRKFLSAFPDEFVTRKNDLEMTLHLANGSIYQVIGADDPDKLVGINCVGAVFSEYALMDPQALRLVLPILNENGGWAIFPSTPRGRNHFYELIQGARKNPRWFVDVRTVDDTKTISKEAIDEDRRMGYDEALIKQEYYCSFDAALQGAYYEDQMNVLADKGRITRLPHDPAIAVDTAWDLGLDDEMVVWFAQRGFADVRIIGFLKFRNTGLLNVINEVITRGRREGFVWGRHFAPHDIRQRELTTASTRWQAARDAGIVFDTVDKANIEDGIQSVRQLLPRCWFDATECEYGIEALKSYRKEYDEKTKTYRNKPAHDWSSHSADAFRMLAMGYQVRKQKAPPNEFDADGDYDPFNPPTDPRAAIRSERASGPAGASPLRF